MNTPTPYEQLIAGKLDQVPVPDMADSVWAGIGMQLDMGPDTPDQGDKTPDGGDDAPGKKAGPGFKGKGWYGFLGVVVVVTTVWWYYHQKVVPAVKAPAAVPAAVPTADSSTRIDNRVEKENIPAASVVVKKDSAQGTIARPDTASQLGAPPVTLPPMKVDSSSLYKDWVPVPFFDSLGVRRPGRKLRGVKGITDDDYKISAEKNHH